MLRLLKHSLALIIGLTSFVASAAIDLPVVVEYMPADNYTGARVSLRPIEGVPDRFSLTYEGIGRKDPAQKDSVSGTISTDVAEGLLEILMRPKPGLEKRSSDPKCYAASRTWKLRTSKMTRMFCADRAARKILSEFISTSSEILRP